MRVGVATSAVHAPLQVLTARFAECTRVEDEVRIQEAELLQREKAAHERHMEWAGKEDSFNQRMQLLLDREMCVGHKEECLGSIQDRSVTCGGVHGVWGAAWRVGQMSVAVLSAGGCGGFQGAPLRGPPCEPVLGPPNFHIRNL